MDVYTYGTSATTPPPSPLGEGGGREGVERRGGVGADPVGGLKRGTGGRRGRQRRARWDDRRAGRERGRATRRVTSRALELRSHGRRNGWHREAAGTTRAVDHRKPHRETGTAHV